MEKSFYYIVAWQEASGYKAVLDELAIPYLIQSPADFPLLKEGTLAIVFPPIPTRLYAKVRTLFTGNGLRYPFRYI
jgi:hypothetical protein